MNRTGEHRDAVAAHLVAEVLAGDTHGTRAGRTQNVHIQVIPLIRGQHRASRGHRRQASTPVLVAFSGGVKPRRQLPIDRRGLSSVPIRCAETC